jgi:hypothetical protein
VDLPDVLSIAEITRRLSQIRDGEAHLRTELPLDNPHNAVLRLFDVTRYIGVRPNEVFLWFPTMTRVKHRLRDRPPPKKALPIPAERQREFSRFFNAWDRGMLVKARIADEWRIVSRHQDASSLGAAPGPQVPPRMIDMSIDPATGRLKFK